MMSPLLVYKHAVIANELSECLAFVTPDNFHTYSALLHSEILDTKDRSLVYEAYNALLEGQFFLGNPMNRWKDNCRFEIEK